MSLSQDARREVALILLHLDIELYKILAKEIKTSKVEEYMDRVRRYIFALCHVLGIENEIAGIIGAPTEAVSVACRNAYEAIRKELFEK